MILRTNARLAGFAFLIYIVVGITHMVLFNQATGAAQGAAATLASIVRNETLVRVTVLLSLLEASSALVLAVTLYALTRDVDRDLALLAFSFRVGEGVLGLVSGVTTLAILSIATAAAGAVASEAATANVLGGLLLKVGGVGTISALCFAVGSTIYSCLFLRARSIPLALAWLGVVASLLWMIGLPLQILKVLGGPATYVMWIPMAVFEVTFALWLILKGVEAPRTR